MTVTRKVHFTASTRGRKQMKVGGNPRPTVPTGRVPRISRLMALAIRFDELLSRGEVKDYAELARLGHVTRARATQIMNLLNLAPDIQEALLFLTPTESGPQASAEALSTRELAVLQLIAQGCSNQEISDRLFISLHTVKTHARHINSKLGVERRTQAVARAKALGLLK